jgi:hypothetical protein
MRVWMRYGGIVILGVSILAGYGSAWISSRVGGWHKNGVQALLLGLVVLDFLPRPQTFVRVEPRPVDFWLASQEPPGALVEFPFEKVADQAQLYYTLTHKKPFFGGSFNAFPPPQYLRIKPILSQFPNDESIELLKTLGVRYVLVHSLEYSNFEDLDREIVELGLQPMATFDDIKVYELEAALGEP